MKKIIIIVCIFFIEVQVSFAQEFSVDYKIQYKYTHHSNLAAIEKSQSESLYLFTGEGQSIFINYNIAHKDEINKKIEEMIGSGYYDSDKSGEKHSNFHKQYYKNYDLQEVWILPALEEYSYIYSEPRVPLKWTILDQEPEEFMGYSVQAATTDFAGRNYTAWFTTEIPIADGPHVFYGLPGLIVDVYDTEKHFRFQLEGIEKPVEELVWEMPNTQEIERSEYEGLSDGVSKMSERRTLDMIREGVAQYENESGGIMTTDEYLFHKRKRDNDHKKNYNPMELE